MYALQLISMQVFDAALNEADFKNNAMVKYFPEGERVTNFEPLDTSAEKLRKKYNNLKAEWRYISCLYFMGHYNAGPISALFL